VSECECVSECVCICNEREAYALHRDRKRDRVSESWFIPEEFLLRETGHDHFFLVLVFELTAGQVNRRETM
jgi:hypothetical protein